MLRLEPQYHGKIYIQIKNMKLNILLSALLIFITLGCKGQKIQPIKNQPTSRIDSIKSTLNLTSNQMLMLKKNDTVISELALIIKDSSKIDRAKKRVTMFFDGKYDLKKLWVSIQLERILQGGNFEFSNDVDPNKALHIENAEEVSQFMKKFDSTVTKKVIFKKKVVKDSIKKKKQ